MLNFDFFEVVIGSVELIGIISLVIFLGIVAMFGYSLFNQKYPIVVFRVFDGNVETKTVRRLYGEKVAPNDIFLLIISGPKVARENIETFNYVLEKSYLFGLIPYVEKIYLAKKVGNLLVPLKYNPNSDVLEGQKVLTAGGLFVKYVNEIEQVEEELKEKNKLMETLYTSLPFLLFVILFGIIAFISTSLMLGKTSEIVKDFKLVAEKNEEITRINQNITEINRELVNTYKELIEELKKYETNVTGVTLISGNQS